MERYRVVVCFRGRRWLLSDPSVYFDNPVGGIWVETASSLVDLEVADSIVVQIPSVVLIRIVSVNGTGSAAQSARS